MTEGNLINLRTIISTSGTIEYKMEVSGSAIDRYGSIGPFKLKNLPERNFGFLYNNLKSLGLEDEDVATQIVLFYPNGVIADFCPEFRRPIFDSILLERMIEDSKFGKSKVLFTRTTAEPMKQFLRKNQFNELAEISYIVSRDYYRLL